MHKAVQLDETETDIICSQKSGLTFLRPLQQYNYNNMDTAF